MGQIEINRLEKRALVNKLGYIINNTDYIAWLRIVERLCD